MKEPRSHDNAAAVHGHAGEGDARPPEPWIDYGHLLPGITAAIRADDCSAVFIVGDSGLGASSLLAQLGNVFGGDLAVVPIHGSPSLTAVPYGVLAPFLSHLSLADISSRVAVLRSLWDHLEGIRVGTGPALLLVDDAHYLDDATCAMLTELVQAGWAKIVAACVPRPGVPGPLLRLWHEGTAEWFDLEPLTAEQGHELCEALLGGNRPEQHEPWVLDRGRGQHPASEDPCARSRELGNPRPEARGVAQDSRNACAHGEARGCRQTPADAYFGRRQGSFELDCLGGTGGRDVD